MTSPQVDPTTGFDHIKEAIADSHQWRELIYNQALLLASIGFRVFPLRRLGKASISTHMCHHSASGNPDTVAKWFNPQSGIYAGYNLGVATGGNSKVMVVDLDCKAVDVNGLEALAALEQQHDDYFPRTMVGATPSGGQHIFVSWHAGLPHGQNVLAAGIDVRSGAADASSGHVVVYPSVVDGKPYSWITGPIAVLQLATAPNWALQHRRPAGANRPDWINNSNLGNEQVSESDVLRDISVEDATSMLAMIPPHDLDYDDWIKIGRAIFSQWPDVVGLSLWDNWSARDRDRHQERDCSSRWVGFTNGRISIGTLVWFAKKYGWKPGPSGEVLVALERINVETPGIIIKGKERWILTDNCDGVSLMGRQAALLYHAVNRVDIGADNKPKLVNPLVLWDSWSGRCLYKRLAMYPYPAREEPEVFNLWNGFPYQPVRGNVAVWLEFVEQIIPDQSDRNWIHDWIAQMFQKPGVKPSTSLVFRGSEGIGKNTFTDTIGMLFHPANWTQFEDTDQALSQFNSQMIYNIWLVMNEALWSGNHKHANKLKGIITEPRLAIELKGVDKFMAPNYSHVVIMTNQDWAVPAGLQSRRFMVVDVPPTLRNYTEFWSEFRAWRSKPESLQALLHWYLSRPITHDLHVVPENRALYRQRTFTEAREDNGIPAEVVMRLLYAGKAAKHTGTGRWANSWFWPNKLIREEWQAITGRSCPSQAASKIRTMVNHLLSAELPRVYVIVRDDQDSRPRRDIYGVAVPDTPLVLIEAVINSGLVNTGDIDVSHDWEDIPNQAW